jgi:hypothetical protein
MNLATLKSVQYNNNYITKLGIPASTPYGNLLLIQLAVITQLSLFSGKAILQFVVQNITWN